MSKKNAETRSRLMRESVVIARERRDAHIKHMRKQRRTPPNCKQQKEASAEIADYIARNPPKVW